MTARVHKDNSKRRRRGARKEANAKSKSKAKQREMETRLRERKMRLGAKTKDLKYFLGQVAEHGSLPELKGKS